MASVGTVTVDFAAQIDAFQRDLRKVDSGLKGLNGSFAAAGKLAGQLFTGASVVGVAAFAKAQFQAADALADTAAQISVNVEALSRLKFAAEQSDVDFATLTTSITKFQKTLSDANSGGKSAAQTFSQIGISAAALRGVRLEDQLGQVANAFQRITDPADRTRIAMQLFGEQGRQLVPLLAAGADGIEELTSQADQLNITLTATAAAGIDSADKALKRLSATLGGIAQNAIGDLTFLLFGTDDQQILMQKRMDVLIERRDALLRGNTSVGTWASEELERINAELVPMETRFRALNDLRNGLGSTSGGGPRRGRNDQPFLAEFQPTASRIEVDPLQEAVERFRTENLERIAEREQQVRDASSAAALEAQRELGQTLNAEVATQLDQEANLRAFYRDQEVQRTQAAELTMQSLRAATLSNGIQALQAFAGQSKSVARALVGIQKARALAEAFMLGKVAVAQAAASAPPPFNLPAIAWAVGFSAANIASIAASGLGQIQSINANSGPGAALGSPTNPVFTDRGGQDDDDDRVFGASQRRVVNITLNSVGWNTAITRDLISAIKEQVDGADVVLFSNDSRQAAELRLA